MARRRLLLAAGLWAVVRRFASAAAPTNVKVAYFFVNRSDFLDAAGVPPGFEAQVAAYRRSARRAGIAVNVTVFHYAAGRRVVEAADPDLAYFWDRVSLDYATVLSNLFRYAWLLREGGVYHDLKCRLDESGLARVVRALESYDLVFEENPSRDARRPTTRKLRNTNMAARPGRAYFRDVLAEMKAKLRAFANHEPESAAARKAVFDVDSHSGLRRVAASRGASPKHHLFLAKACDAGTTRSPANCTDADAVSGAVAGDTWTAFKWRVRATPAIAQSYGGAAHWSRVPGPILVPPRPPSGS